MAAAYGSTCGRMTTWLVELSIVINSSSSDLSFGTIIDVMGALWRRVQKLVVAHWRANGGKSSTDL
jgi:hypothetical protein